MCYEFTVPVPNVPGKITYQKRSGRTYVYYEYARIYHKDKGYNVPRKDAIGKLDANDDSLMYPNPKYYKHFPDEVIPSDEIKRPPCQDHGLKNQREPVFTILQHFGQYSCATSLG